MISISTDGASEVQTAILIHKDSGDSVSVVAKVFFTLIPFEGNNTRPTPLVTRFKGVYLQVKTDPEQRSPGWNCFNLSISLYISRRTYVFPHQMSVGSISWRVKFVPSKDTNILECPGIFVYDSMYFLSINRDRVVNLYLTLLNDLFSVSFISIHTFPLPISNVCSIVMLYHLFNLIELKLNA